MKDLKTLFGVLAAALWVSFIVMLLAYVDGWIGRDLFLDAVTIAILSGFAAAAAKTTQLAFED